MNRASRRRLGKAVPVRSPARMASAIPGASRSITFLVPSGVRSVGEKPVPPVVTRRPAKDDDSATKASETGATPSGYDAALHDDEGVQLQHDLNGVSGKVDSRPGGDRVGNGEDLRWYLHPV